MLKIHNIIKVTLFVIMSIILQTNNVYAGIAKWDAYPEWGIVLKISIITLYVAISITVIGIIVKFMLDKLNKKVNIIDKIINIVVFMAFCISVISRIIVELNIYNNAEIYLLIGIIVCFFFVLLTRNIKALSTKKFYAIILCILIILLITNDNAYPHEYNDVLYIDILKIL